MKRGIKEGPTFVVALLFMLGKRSFVYLLSWSIFPEFDWANLYTLLCLCLSLSFLYDKVVLYWVFGIVVGCKENALLVEEDFDLAFEGM